MTFSVDKPVDSVNNLLHTCVIMELCKLYTGIVYGKNRTFRRILEMRSAKNAG